ncbi:MAG: helix-turn-helix domain-containing protein [Thermoflexibacteraceae bacterium]
MTDNKNSEEVSKTGLALLQSVKTKIRQMREAKELSQEDVARLLKMSTSGFSKIEGGENDINVTRLSQIAEVFKTPIVDFFPNSTTNNKTINTTAHQINTVLNDVNHCIVQQEPQKEIEQLKQNLAALETRLVLIESHLKTLLTTPSV